MSRASILVLLGACSSGLPHTPSPSRAEAGERAADASARVDLSSGQDELVPQDDAEIDEYGAMVNAAGDLDGDGLADAVVGVPGDGTLGAEAGAAYVYYGDSAGIFPESSEETLRASDGAAGDRLGEGVDGAGDVDGDGYDDLIVGAWGQDDGATDGGAAYLWYGSPSGLVDETRLTDPDPEAFDSFGYSVSDAGDVDADGYDDVLVGAGLSRVAEAGGGSVFLFMGSSSGLDSAGGTELWPSDLASYDRFGQAVASAGDVDGDGYDDVLIGAWTAESGGLDNAGAAYVWHGSSTGLDAGSETRLSASSPTEAGWLGKDAEGAGDVDNDGYDDVILGAPGTDSETGAAWVFLGSATGVQTGSAQELQASDGAAGDAFGSGVDGAGDLDGDGYDDVVVGAPERSGTKVDNGGAYVYYGAPGGVSASSEQVVEVASPSNFDGLGNAVAGTGDADGDGFPDLLIGASTRYRNSRKDRVGGAYSWTTECTDADGDGTCAVSDCDDDDAAVGPGSVWFIDQDEDGYGDSATATASLRCEAPEGHVDLDGDCDDLDPAVNPGATEGIADGIDQDCDGLEECYADLDGDGVRAADGATVSSEDGDCSDAGEAIESSPADDCDDTDAAVRPGATEQVGDGVDQDCDGSEECYVDADSDGHRADASSTVSSADADCEDAGEADASAPVDDCDDSDDTVYEGAPELPGDEVDQDCDGHELCYLDADDDGYIAEGDLTLASSDLDCTDLGEGLHNAPRDDCDDNRANTHPGAKEECNGIDDDCDGSIDGSEATGFGTWERDQDGDGYTVSSSTASGCEPPEGYARPSELEDCNDLDPTVFPGAEEVAGDGKDQDCDQEDLRGCGCSSGSLEASSAGLLALLMLGTLVRRESVIAHGSGRVG